MGDLSMGEGELKFGGSSVGNTDLRGGGGEEIKEQCRRERGGHTYM